MKRRALAVLLLGAALGAGCAFQVEGVSAYATHDGATDAPLAIDAPQDGPDAAPAIDLAGGSEGGSEGGAVDLASSEAAAIDLASPDLTTVDLLPAVDLAPLPDLHVAGFFPQASGTTNRLSGVWGTSATNIYIVGAKGTILHSVDGATWTPEVNPAQAAGTDLFGVFGTGPSDIWAVGATQTILHSTDGLTWTAVAAPGVPAGTAFYAVWAQMSSSNVFAFGQGTWYERSTNAGGAFSNGAIVFNKGDAFSAWGTAPTNLYVATANGIYHTDGTNWTRYVMGDLRAIWSVDGQNLYASGTNALIVTHNGSPWTSLTVPADVYDGIWGPTPNEVYVVSQHGRILHTLDGMSFVELSSGTTVSLNGVWGPATGNVYVVGDSGTILHYQP